MKLILQNFTELNIPEVKKLLFLIEDVKSGKIKPNKLDKPYTDAKIAIDRAISKIRGRQGRMKYDETDTKIGTQLYNIKQDIEKNEKLISNSQNQIEKLKKEYNNLENQRKEVRKKIRMYDDWADRIEYYREVISEAMRGI